MERRARPALTCACFFVAIYSLLPHKELRFVLPATPPIQRVRRRRRRPMRLSGPGHPPLEEDRRGRVGRHVGDDTSDEGRRADASAARARRVWVMGSERRGALCVCPPRAKLPRAAPPSPGCTRRDREGRGFDPGSGARRRGRRDDGRVSLGESADDGSGWVYSKEEGLAPSELALRGFKYLVSGRARCRGTR